MDAPVLVLPLGYTRVASCANIADLVLWVVKPHWMSVLSLNRSKPTLALPVSTGKALINPLTNALIRSKPLWFILPLPSTAINRSTLLLQSGRGAVVVVVVVVVVVGDVVVDVDVVVVLIILQAP
jgi:hypothetical protein